MKKFLLLLITSFCVSCATQPPQGLYYDEKSGCMACVHHDSIAIGYKRNPSEKFLLYYYGNYTLEQRNIILSNNYLRYNNMIIEEKYTDYPGIEIQLYEQQKLIVLGKKNENDSIYYQLANHCEAYLDFDPFYQSIFTGKRKHNAITTHDGLIQLPMDSLTTKIDNTFDFFILGCANFFSEVKITPSPHTRYVIKQKSLYHRPMIPQEVPVVFNAKNNQIEITESSSINDEPYRTFQLKYVGKVDSCLEELRKRYPDL